MIVPVPLHSGRLKERGFNQAEALSNRVGELLGVPVDTSILKRRVNIPHQTRLGLEPRQRNVRDAFEPRQLSDGMHIMLIDDVTTTGSTLKAAGATRVDAAVFAKEV